ncbi:MAG: SUMF1/EgtB/PvdO family nonheme iron enzyme [Solirubrobacterales bacterium]|nr:SUMF1/EgtB/PvdO family nonheme iron enzyme [Solirubrobacterales bacterium]
MTLVEPLSEEQLNRVYSPILSPLIWDLGHIANFEEQWLIREIAGREALRGDLGALYDAIEQPRKVRGELPILTADEVFPYMEQVRERTLEVLDDLELDPSNPLLAGGFVYEMLLAHEHQHNETMLQLLQMIESYEPARTDDGPAGEPVTEGPESVQVPGGEHSIGAGAEGFSYDNERPRHTVELNAFEIDRTSVTNADYMSFLEEAPGAEPPMYWERDGEGGWVRTAMGRRDEVDPALPVIHVSWHEAEAFARWAGKRLPTEFEWEAAAAGADAERANLDLFAFGPTPAGAYGDAPSDHGALQMLGDVWEWTSSEFEGYPGFEAFPYPEYSEVFYGQGHKVLRGGAWSTRRGVIRPTFRNWDNPERKQIFSGFRCVQDV